jgi:signal transduction histidine kinase/CheY-like chemotaxis protein
VKLKTSLMTLAVCSVVPLAIFASIAVVVLVEDRLDTLRRETSGRAVSAMSAVDAKLRGSITTLEALATSGNLRAGNLGSFYDEARRVLATQPDWLNLGLATAEGDQLIDAILPFGQSAPFASDSAFERAVETGKPAIGEVMAGTAVRDPVVRIRLPVTFDGKVRYVLSAPIKSSVFIELLRAQRIDPGWGIALIDHNRNVVARIPDVPAGTPVSAALGAELVRSKQGWIRATSREGIDTYTSYVTSALSGWTLAIAIPVGIVDAATWQALGIAGGGALAALAFALTLAWLMARRIEAPVAALADATAAMARGSDTVVEASGRIEEVSRLQAAFREASRAVRQRRELAEREKAALQREQQALRASDTAKDEFIAMLSHELRNPLGALAGAVHVLKAAKLADPDAARAREVVERQTSHMTRLVEDLLDVSRIVSGKANLQPERFDLGEASRQLVDAWRTHGRFSGRAVLFDARPVHVYADRARMEQILVNLLDNAIKFTPTGATIRVSVGQEDGHAMLRVDDEGDGIDGEALPHVFDLFSQGRQDLARRKGGLGIGLAIVKRLAEMQGASVEARSAGNGRGSSFIVRMPVCDELPASADQAPADAASPSGQSPRRILVIDDNDDMREMLCLTLAGAGRDVHEARDGASGLVRAAEAKPDVVLVDVGLPDIDGYEVARRLRARPDGAELRLIALTGYGQDEDRRRAAEAGFDAHLTKPVTPELLERAIVAVSAHAKPRESGAVIEIR